MLTIKVGEESYDEINNQFILTEQFVLELEHSLVSLSKWEAKYEKPFLGSEERTTEEVYGYIKAMVVSGECTDEMIARLSKKNLEDINDYISSEQSATTFYDPFENKAKRNEEIITSELIYYWMVSYTIPFECETWHLNRLFALLRICNIKNSKEKKLTRSELAARNRDLNNQRKKELGTSG